MSVPEFSIASNGAVTEAETLVVDAEFKSLAVEAVENTVTNVGLGIAGAAMTGAAGVELGLNPLADAGAAVLDAAEVRRAAMTVEEERAAMAFVRAHPKEFARLVGEVEKEAGNLVAGLEKTIPSGFEAKMEALFAEVKTELAEVKAGQATGFKKLGGQIDQLLTESKAILANSIEIVKRTSLRVALGIAMVSGTAAPVVDYGEKSLLLERPGDGENPPHKLPSPQDVQLAERLWWHDQADADAQPRRPSGREFEVRWNNLHDGATFSLPGFAPHKMNGIISSVTEQNVVQDVGGGQQVTYPIETLLYGLSGRERAEAFDHLKKLEDQAVELKVNARGFEAKSLNQLALQALADSSRDAQGNRLHFFERYSDGRVLSETMSPGDRTPAGKLHLEGTLLAIQYGENTRYFAIDELRRFSREPERLNAFLLRACETREFAQIAMDGQGTVTTMNSRQLDQARQLAQSYTLGHDRA